jgi:hypothetical protein
MRALRDQSIVIGYPNFRRGPDPRDQEHARFMNKGLLGIFGGTRWDICALSLLRFFTGSDGMCQNQEIAGMTNLDWRAVRISFTDI